MTLETGITFASSLAFAIGQQLDIQQQEIGPRGAALVGQGMQLEQGFLEPPKTTEGGGSRRRPDGQVYQIDRSEFPNPQFTLPLRALPLDAEPVYPAPREFVGLEMPVIPYATIRAAELGAGPAAKIKRSTEFDPSTAVLEAIASGQPLTPNKAKTLLTRLKASKLKR